jgi:hypothetical protein
MFTIQDLYAVYSRACDELIKLPARVRLKGDTRDLTADEMRTLAFYQASLIHAYTKVGTGDPAELEELFPKFEASDLEKTLDEGF